MKIIEAMKKVKDPILKIVSVKYQVIRVAWW